MRRLTTCCLQQPLASSQSCCQQQNAKAKRKRLPPVALAVSNGTARVWNLFAFVISQRVRRCRGRRKEEFEPSATAYLTLLQRFAACRAQFVFVRRCHAAVLAIAARTRKANLVRFSSAFVAFDHLRAGQFRSENPLEQFFKTVQQFRENQDVSIRCSI